MTEYARIQNGMVVELLNTTASLDTLFVASYAAEFVVVPSGVSPVQGWLYSNGTFSAPPAPPAPTLAQDAEAALNNGLAITSTSTPALNATYAVDPTSQQFIEGVAENIKIEGTFPGGAETMEWPVISGSPVTFPNTTDFINFAEAASAYITGLMDATNGISTTLPTASATIA